MDDVSTIARTIGRLRRERRLSLDEVAKLAGLSKAHVWAMEKGTSRNPTIACVRSLAGAFGVSFATIIGEDIQAPALSEPAMRVAVEFDAAVRAALQAASAGGGADG